MFRAFADYCVRAVGSASGALTRKRKRESDEDDAAREATGAAACAQPSSEAAALDAVIALLEADFQCAICQSTVVVPHLLSCGHRFCGACIFTWTQRKSTCPTCRAETQGAPARERGVVRTLLRRSYELALTQPSRRTS